jgi:hypothetical protein
MTKEIFKLTIEAIAPDEEEVFLLQGIPRGTLPPDRVRTLYRSAAELFLQSVAPVCMMADISSAEFSQIYSGKGLNEKDTPLEHIFPRAYQLGVFACTMGPAVSLKIEELMKSKTNTFPLGYMLDTIASHCAENAAIVAETLFLNRLPAPTEGLKVLLYSPGYCGWHISGQEKLFQYLQPAAIGIKLNPSFLMVPLKSISGVLVAGPAFMHDFDNDFPFCQQCQTLNCRQRILR